jgi:hypothetical protein
VELEVADTQGKVLLRQKAKTNRPTQIDMRQLANGIYFLRGKSDKVFYTSKILVD